MSADKILTTILGERTSYVREKRVQKEASKKELRATDRLRGKYVFCNRKYVPRDASGNGKKIAGRM